MKKFLLSTLVITVLLFLWSGLTQILPWGITTAQNISVQTNGEEEQLQAPTLLQLPQNALTTDQFDTQFNNKISTYATNETFSWIVSQPFDGNYTGYFMRELLTQLAVACLLTILLLLTVQLDWQRRIGLIVLAGSAASLATYVQFMNWWGMPAAYALGVSLNLIVGWALAGFVSARFIIKSQEGPKR